MKRLIIFILLSIALTACAKKESRPEAAEETIIQTVEDAKTAVLVATNRDYFPVAHHLIDNAQKSVKVVVFQARYYLAYPGSSTNVLLLDLAQAVDRGVEVTVILDCSAWNKSSSELNRLVGDLLEKHGVKVFYDDPEITTHDKLVLVDDQYVLIGSTNWNNWAFERNNEANLLINSPEVNQDYAAHFDHILSTATPDYPFASPVRTLTDNQWDEGTFGTVTVSVESTEPGYRDKSVDLVIGRDLEINVDRDIAETVKFIDPEYFTHISGREVTLTVLKNRQGKRVFFDTYALFDSTMIAQFYESALSDAEEDSLQSLRSVPTAWITVDSLFPVNNEAYFDSVHQLLQEARERVWMVMMDSRYYDEKPTYARKTERTDPPSLTNILREDLIQAEGRGVDVKLVFDQASWDLNEDAIAFMQPLLQAGGELFKDSEEATTHAKLLVIDNDIVVIGSTNWSYSAIEENNESSVIIKSGELNRVLAEYTAQVRSESTPVKSFE